MQPQKHRRPDCRQDEPKQARSQAGDRRAATADAAIGTGGGGGVTSDAARPITSTRVAALAEIAVVNAVHRQRPRGETATLRGLQTGARASRASSRSTEAFMLAVWGEPARRWASRSRASQHRAATVSISRACRAMAAAQRSRSSLDPAPAATATAPRAAAIAVDLLAVWHAFRRAGDTLMQHSARPEREGRCALFEDRVSRVVEAADRGRASAHDRCSPRSPACSRRRLIGRRRRCARAASRERAAAGVGATRA